MPAKPVGSSSAQIQRPGVVNDSSQGNAAMDNRRRTDVSRRSSRSASGGSRAGGSLVHRADNEYDADSMTAVQNPVQNDGHPLDERTSTNTSAMEPSLWMQSTPDSRQPGPSGQNTEITPASSTDAQRPIEPSMSAAEGAGHSVAQHSECQPTVASDTGTPAPLLPLHLPLQTETRKRRGRLARFFHIKPKET